MQGNITDWGKEVKKGLIERDWSINDLAERIGKSRTRVSGVVNGRIYSDSIASAISDLLNIEKASASMQYMSGEKQVIMTGELFGAEWKIKIDSFVRGIAITDLKVMASITKLEWVKDIGYLDFVRYWGYDIQGAIYQEIVYQNTGERLPFYIAAGTKEEEPNIEVIQVTQNYLDEAKHMVETNMPRILRVKNGEAEPDRCEMCDCCRHTKVLKRPISITNLVAGI